jgi:RHS repeat-associated protein
MIMESPFIRWLARVWHRKSANDCKKRNSPTKRQTMKLLPYLLLPGAFACCALFLAQPCDAYYHADGRDAPAGHLLPPADPNQGPLSPNCQEAELFPAFHGYRYYNASTGRWLSRDPIGEADCPNLYNFVLNAPVFSYDTLGLFGCQRDPCADPCGDAKKKGLDRGDAGGIVCCNGKPYSCVWDPGGPTGGKNKKAREIIAKCIKAHEDTHVPDTVCPPAPDFSRGGPGKGKDTKQSECDAYKAEAACLKASLGQCDGDPQCLAQVMADMRDVRDQITFYCTP